MGGLHASLNYTEACSYCDYVLLGEGEESILDFIRAYVSNKEMDFAGIAFKRNGEVINTGKRCPPANIDIIPDRSLLYRYDKMAGHNTIWPQVHASRGCPHSCDYCAVVRHFGRKVRTRTPENIIEDIKYSIDFHEKGHHRLVHVLWLTDDNFFADRDWAVDVLKKIAEADFKYSFTIQARYEVGFDDEMLGLLKKAVFAEIAIGIEFLEDKAFKNYNKKCTYSDLLLSIENIQKHGLNVRGLFILGADNHEKGVGKTLAEFVISHNICGTLIQSMYFIPGTVVYESHKDKLLHTDWSKYNGNVVHYPEKMTPYELQKEVIKASAAIYSFKRLIYKIFTKRGLERFLFIGEYFWQKHVRKALKKELKQLKHY